jgi:hypothetical protein
LDGCSPDHVGHLRDSTYGNFSDFLNDYSGSIRQVIADPNVMLLASAIRGLTYTKTGGIREIGTPDAIHLASAIVMERNYGVPVTGFHTFDDGKRKALEGGKAVPLPSYETWCESCLNDPIAKRVIALKRSRPDHPNPKLPLPAPAQQPLPRLLRRQSNPMVQKRIGKNYRNDCTTARKPGWSANSRSRKSS